MSSPFPGMDPWLEDPDEWGGVHTGLIYGINAELNRVLPVGVRAKIDQFVWVREDEERTSRQYEPDVFLPKPRKLVGPSSAIAEPLSRPTARSFLPKGRRQTHRRVIITTRNGQHVLTVIEVLSPSNKGSNRNEYLQKRREYLSSVNFVEIDLLRAGARLPMGRPEPPTTHYYVFSCRKDEYPASDVWAFNIQDPLPVVPVPISSDFADAPLSLRAALDRFYEDGKFEEVDYSQPPNPPLAPQDASWANNYLKKLSKRTKDPHR